MISGWKSVKLLVLFGLSLVVIGEALRISAMLTAARSFSHTLELRRREDHTLVTTGVYSFCRHPSYAGRSPNPIPTPFYSSSILISSSHLHFLFSFCSHSFSLFRHTLTLFHLQILQLLSGRAR